jgi:hypothetical protein
MSVFRVQLANLGQGNLDVDMITGQPVTTSIQRQVYVMGPHRINRELKDGDTFTDCNYWKRFAYPQVPLNEAFISVVTDDGSIYSDYEVEQTFLKNYTLNIANSTTFTLTANQANILADTGGYAVFTQIANNGTGSVSVQVNGAATSTFTLGSGETQIFNAGELAVSLVSFANSSGSTQAVQVLVSVRSQATS